MWLYSIEVIEIQCDSVDGGHPRYIVYGDTGDDRGEGGVGVLGDRFCGKDERREHTRDAECGSVDVVPSGQSKNIKKV